MKSPKAPIEPVIKHTLTHNTYLLQLDLENNPSCVNTQEPNFVTSMATHLYHDKTINKVRHALYTPIFYAIRDGNDTSFDLLIEHKDIDITITDSHGNTILNNAVEAAFRTKNISYAEKILRKPEANALIHQKNCHCASALDHVNTLIKQTTMQYYDRETMESLLALKNLFEFYS
ncbi:hypothetical protein Noda2021_11160 [Candidatus Dependentiae bacterium Noda2021]|nr:hypothetical protein Noda2021_11160 [Candidatus Dependentiae bacterium Noda2021]